MISKKEFTEIKNWIYRNARPLDFARWKYHFENGRKVDVLDVLASFQNNDGGFGHALEPDLWNPNSTPVNTSFAILSLSDIDMHDTSHPIIQGILNYLESGKDYQNERWHALVPANNDFPHGGWWTFKDGLNEKEWGYYPTLTLIGFILEHGNNQSNLYKTAVEIAKEAIDKYINRHRIVIGERGGLCFAELVQYCERAGVLQPEAKLLKNFLIKNINLIVTTDETKWKQYCLRPSELIKSPQCDFYGGNEKLVESEIQLLMKTRDCNGVWDINWVWDEYHTAYAVSANWWRAKMAIDKLLFLKSFGKIKLS